MNLILEEDHPLAVAIRSAPLGQETWLLIKSPGVLKPSSFRALISQYEVNINGTTSVWFESWEEYMERKATMAGL